MAKEILEFHIALKPKWKRIWREGEPEAKVDELYSADISLGGLLEPMGTGMTGNDRPPGVIDYLHPYDALDELPYMIEVDLAELASRKQIGVLIGINALLKSVPTSEYHALKSVKLNGKKATAERASERVEAVAKAHGVPLVPGDVKGVFGPGAAGSQSSSRAKAPSQSAPLNMNELLFLMLAQLEYPCSPSDLNRAIREIAKRLHPDTTGGDELSVKRMAAINAGYQSLRGRIPD